MIYEHILRGVEAFEKLQRFGPTSIQILLYILQKGLTAEISPSELTYNLKLSPDLARKKIERLHKAGFLIRKEKGSYSLNLGTLLSALIVGLQYEKIKRILKKLQELKENALKNEF
ncbi:MAG: hypothetical protein ACTSX9_04625 [Candidatus Njordarchaeales archaeon]